MDPQEIEQPLNDALGEMQALQARLESGEEVDEKELTALARHIATQIEQARARLEAALGPVDREALKAEMRERMSPEEIAEYEEIEPDMLEFRAEVAREGSLREQLSDGR